MSLPDDCRLNVVDGQKYTDEERIDLAPGFYVHGDCDNPAGFAIKPGFMRRIDAELAAMALSNAGLDSIEKLRDAGKTAVHRTMFEALQW